MSWIKAQLVEAEKDFSSCQQAEGNAFSVNCRDCGYSDVNFFPFDAHVDASILGKAFFSDIHATHDFHTRDQSRLKSLELRWHGGLVQDSVDAVADTKFVLRRLEVNVRGSVLKSFPDNLVHELDHAGFLIAFGDLLVFADNQLDGFIFLQLIQCLSAHAVIFLQGLVDLRGSGQAKIHRS